MTYQKKISLYESEKSRLNSLNLTPREYEKKLKQILKELHL